MSRAARFVVVGAMLAVAVTTTIWFAFDEDTTRSARLRRVRDPITGLAISVPVSWRAGALLPEGGGGVSAENGPVTWSEEDPCSPNDHTHVDLSISKLNEGTESARRRPPRFTSRSGTGLVRDRTLPCGAHVQRIDYVSGGEVWTASLRFAGSATDLDRQRAYAILESARP